VFSSIRTVFFKALTSPVRCFKAVASEEDSTLFITANNVFRFIDLHKEDVSVICDFKR